MLPDQSQKNLNAFATNAHCPSSRWPFVSKVLGDLIDDAESHVPRLVKPWLAVDWSTVDVTDRDHPEECFRPRLVVTASGKFTYEQYELTASVTTYAFGNPLTDIGKAAGWAKKLSWRGEAITSGTIGVSFGGYNASAKLAVVFKFSGDEFIRSPLVARANLTIAGGGVTFRGALSMMYPCPYGSVARAVGNVNFGGVGTGVFSSVSIHAVATAYCEVSRGDIFLSLNVKVEMAENIAGVFSLEDAHAEAKR